MNQPTNRPPLVYPQHAEEPKKEQVIGVYDATGDQLLKCIYDRLQTMNEYEHFSMLNQYAGAIPQSFGFVSRKLVYLKNTGTKDLNVTFNDDAIGTSSQTIAAGAALENVPLHINRLVVQSDDGTSFSAFGLY